MIGGAGSTVPRSANAKYDGNKTGFQAEKFCMADRPLQMKDC